MPSALRVSVVIPCLNEQRNLARVIDAILMQDLPSDEYEVVLVDGGSVDGSVEIAESLGVRVVHSPRGVSAQRNRGALETTAPVLAFLDSDCVAPPDWLSRGLRMIEDHGAVLAGGPALTPDGSNWTARTFDIHLVVRRSRLLADSAERFRLITTANMFVRRAVFEQVGCFDESLVSGEDSLLCTEIAVLGMPVSYDEGLAVIHLGVPASAGAFFRQQVWHSNAASWRLLSERTGGAAVGQNTRRYGLLTIGMLALVIIGGVYSLVSQTIWPLLAAVAAYAAIPLALAARTCMRIGSLRPLLPLTGVYAIFGLAPALYLLGLFRLDYRRSVPEDQRRRAS
jgi:glycosyltransferase involved in cell wall biosynthesis